MWPEYRSGLYSVWKACTRLGMRPPGVPATWEEAGVQLQAAILAFNQVCEHDEAEQVTRVL